MKKCVCSLGIMVVIVLLMSNVACKNENIGKQSQGNGSGIVSSNSFPNTLNNPNLNILMTEQSRVDEEFTDPIAQFEKKYGGKVIVEVVAPGQKDSKLITAIVSGSSYDLTRWVAGDMPKYAIKGILQPINDLVDLTDPVWEYGMKANVRAWYAGKLYGICAEPQIGLVYFNQDIFENNGIKTPLELFNEGKWNWAAMRDAASRLTQIDASGATLLQGIGLGPSMILNFLLPSNDTDMIQISSDGVITLDIYNSKVIEALQFYQDMFFLDKSLFSGPPVRNAANFAEGKLAMYIAGDQQSKGDTFAGLRSKWDIAPVPLGPSNTEGLLAGGGGYFGIPVGALNPEGAAVMMWLRQKTTNDDIELRLVNLGYTPEQARRLILWRDQPVNLSMSLGIENFNTINNSMLGELRNGMPVLTVLATFAPQFQEAIDAMTR